jgi:hypothetical protein
MIIRVHPSIVDARNGRSRFVDDDEDIIREFEDNAAFAEDPLIAFNTISFVLLAHPFYLTFSQLYLPCAPLLLQCNAT